MIGKMRRSIASGGKTVVSLIRGGLTTILLSGGCLAGMTSGKTGLLLLLLQGSQLRRRLEKGAAKAAEGDDDEANAPPEMDMVANEYSESRRGSIRKKKKVDDSADGGDTRIEVDVEQ